MTRGFLVLLTGMLIGCQSLDPGPTDRPYILVLGTGQDGGIPQVGHFGHPGWTRSRHRRLVSCLALIDPRQDKRWLFDATPDFREQVFILHDQAPRERISHESHRPLVDGIFLTHAHIGHYTGLMFLGHESLGARNVPVYAMPRMRRFLETSGPWSQLVQFGNIELRDLEDRKPVALSENLTVQPILVPHRQEFSEVVGYRIDGPNASVLYLPDIDSWEEWDDEGTRIEDLITEVDVAYLDGTFFQNGELPGRDMTGFPHPFIVHSVERFSSLPPRQRSKIRFIHLNHSNPAQFSNSAAALFVRRAGMSIAVDRERFGL